MTYYEIKKVFSRKSSQAALLIILGLLMVVFYFIMSDNYYVNENGDNVHGLSAIAKIREAKKEWAGELTEEKIQAVITENVRISQTPEALSKDFQQNDIAYHQKQGFLDIRQLLVASYSGFSNYDYYLPDSLSPGDAADFYPNRMKNLKDWLDTDAKDRFSEKEKAYLIEQYEALQTPLYYDYHNGWESLFTYSPTVIMVLTIILGFLCAGIFSGEFQQKASPVFYSSYYGRNRGISAKIKAGLVIISGLYWGVMLLYSGCVLGILGADGAACQIQASSSGWKSIYNITIWQKYLLIVFCGYLGCLFLLLLTMLVSAKTNSAVVAVLVPFILIFLPSFLSGTSIPLLDKILGLLPDQLLQMNLSVKYFSLYEIGGRVLPALPVLIVIYSVLSLALVPVVYFTYRKKQVH